MAETGTEAAAAVAAQRAEKSRGQVLLDRMVGQVDRIGRIRLQLELTHARIAPAEGAAASVSPASGLPSAPAASFFELVEWICDHGDQALDQLEQRVAEVDDEFALTFHVKPVL